MANGVTEGSSLQQRLHWYAQLDRSRKDDLEALVNQVADLQKQLEVTQGDLEDEQFTRRNYRKRAEEAEIASSRNRFALVLIDGDGYRFRDTFFRDGSESGGAEAARALYSEVTDYLRASIESSAQADDLEIVVNVYANKTGLSRSLHDAGIISMNHFESFFCSFTQSRPLFNFIDCGPGKERVDAKLRDTYRFFAYNIHCRYIFLACCHDNGYVAELDKYRYDPTAAPKTILVHLAQPARLGGYATLPFPAIRFASVFEPNASILKPPNNSTTKVHVATNNTTSNKQQLQQQQPQQPPQQQHTNGFEAVTEERSPSVISSSKPTYSSISSPVAVPAAVPLRPITNVPANKVATVPKSKTPEAESEPAKGKGIPLNRLGQRVDRHLRMPTKQEQADFENRIYEHKLCNEHHLRDNCHVYNCKYDHEPIDEGIRHALRYTARRIACNNGTQCRRADCYLGHHCPWGAENCSNYNCGFIRAGLHDVDDLEIVKIVPADRHG